MSVIDIFLWRLLTVSLHVRSKCFCLSFAFYLEQISNINICHKVASKHPKVIGGGWQLIAKDVFDYGEVAEDGVVKNDGNY